MELQTYETLNYTQGLGNSSHCDSSAKPSDFIRRLAAQLHETVVAPLLRKQYARRAIAQLEAMDDRMLDDIGLGRWEIETAVRSGMDAVIRNRGRVNVR